MRRPHDKKDRQESAATEAHLAEYAALRAEQHARTSMSSRLLNLIVVITGAVVAAYVQLTINNRADVFFDLLLVVPVLPTTLILFYYDNQLMIYRIGRYLSEVIYPHLRRIGSNKNFGWEDFHSSSSNQLWIVALGRNLFFLIVTATPPRSE